MHELKLYLLQWKEPDVSSNENKRFAYKLLALCLAGDVAHAKVLQTLIDAHLISCEELGITPDDMVIFQTLSRIADPKTRAVTAFCGCRKGRVLANFGVIRCLINTQMIKLPDLIEGEDSLLKVGSDLTHFSEEHSASLPRILALRKPPQD